MRRKVQCSPSFFSSIYIFFLHRECDGLSRFFFPLFHLSVMRLFFFAVPFFYFLTISSFLPTTRFRCCCFISFHCAHSTQVFSRSRSPPCRLFLLTQTVGVFSMIMYTYAAKVYFKTELVFSFCLFRRQLQNDSSKKWCPAAAVALFLSVLHKTSSNSLTLSFPGSWSLTTAPAVF